MTQRVLPVALIAIGVIWLLFLTGFVPPSLGAALGRLWPLLLIAAGLDIWIPERRPLDLYFVAWAGIAIILIALVWPGDALSRGGQEAFHVLDTETRRVAMEISSGSAATEIRGATSNDTLIDARFSGEARGTVSVAKGRTTRVRVEGESGFFNLFSGGGRWDLQVPVAVPLELRVDGGSGAVSADLVDTMLDKLDLDVGSGRVDVSLPGGGTPYRVDVDGGSGRLDLRVAPGASVDMAAELGSGQSRIFVGEGTDIRFELDTGSGAVEIDLPDSAPIRLSIDDDGSGPLSLPRFLERRSGRGDTGVWESANLMDGGRVIDLRIVDVGSGPITIR